MELVFSGTPEKVQGEYIGGKNLGNKPHWEVYL